MKVKRVSRQLPSDSIIRKILVYIKERIKDIVNPFKRIMPVGTNGIESEKYYEDKIRKLKERRASVPSLSAVIRVKDGKHFIAAQIKNIVCICTQIVVVDNYECPETEKIVKELSVYYKEDCEIVYRVYGFPVHRYGVDYKNKLLENPDGSIAKYYNYAFSFASGQYAWKVDLHNLYTLNALENIQATLSKNVDVILLDGLDCAGRRVSLERRIFRVSSGCVYEDANEYEYLKVPKELLEIKLRWPSYIHIRGLYSK